MAEEIHRLKQPRGRYIAIICSGKKGLVEGAAAAAQATDGCGEWMPVANVRRPTLWLSANRLIVFDLKSVLFNALYGCLGHPSSTPYPVLSSTRQSPSDAPLWAVPDRRGSDKGVEIQKRKRGRGDR